MTISSDKEYDSLAEAIAEIGSEIRTIEVLKIKGILDLDPSYQPSPDRPLVYHLHGYTETPQSMILTRPSFFHSSCARYCPSQKTPLTSPSSVPTVPTVPAVSG